MNRIVTNWAMVNSWADAGFLSCEWECKCCGQTVMGFREAPEVCPHCGESRRYKTIV